MQPTDEFSALRVVDAKTAAKLLNLSDRTFDRLRARGEGPSATRISERRIGFRICDLKAWLDGPARGGVTVTPLERLRQEIAATRCRADAEDLLTAAQPVLAALPERVRERVLEELTDIANEKPT